MNLWQLPPATLIKAMTENQRERAFIVTHPQTGQLQASHPMLRNRAWRRQQRKRIIYNRFRFLRDMKDERAKSLKGGYLVKRHPYDCGRTRCGVCHPHKKWKGNHRYPIRIRKEPLE